VTRNPQQDDKSRSQLKREFREVKELGKQLARLSEGQLRAMSLSERLLDALLATKGMARNAVPRQYRYIASLLTEEDLSAVQAAVASASQPHADAVDALHEMERWRDRLLGEDEAELTAFVERYPECDRKHLRQLVRNARKERDLDKPPKSARQLFRYIRQLAEQAD